MTGCHAAATARTRLPAPAPAAPAAKQCQHQELHFETVSAGILSVQRVQLGGAQLMRMSLPLYDPVEQPPAAAAPGSALVRACIGDLPLKEARWGATAAAGGMQHQSSRCPCQAAAVPCRYVSKDNLCYVLLALGDGVSRAQLEALVPDVAAMHAAASAEQVHGVIVSTAHAAPTAAGGPGLGCSCPGVQGAQPARRL